MANCIRIEECTFFRGAMESMPANAELYKKKYCRDQYDTCARNILIKMVEERSYQLSEETEAKIEKYSYSLAPNQHDKVRELFSA